jgi:SAM-dependent methyltransferase
VLEHFGLGRYGDAIDPNGYKTGLANMARMLRPGGIFYFSVPIGPQRIEFNAHRIFAIRHLLELFAQNGLSVSAFSYVRDDGDLIENAELTAAMIDGNCNGEHGCGIFELRK